MNFKVTTWRFSQWVATITFIGIMYIFKNQYFGNWKDIELYFSTPLGYISLIACLVAQFYVYGGFISNTIKDILIPLLIIGIVLVAELAFSYVMIKLDYTPVWSAYLIRYALLFFQGLMQLWVYRDVEYVIIPKEDLPELFDNLK